MVELPKDRKSRIEALDELGKRGDEHARLQQVRWMVSHYWLQGLRNLQIDFTTADVRSDLHNQIGPNNRLNMVYEPILPKLQTERGRLGRMDLRPAVKPVSYGLYNIRKAATARVELDYLTSTVDWEDLKRTAIYHDTAFGTFGVGVWINDKPGLGSPPPAEELTGEGLTGEEGESPQPAAAGPTPESQLEMEIIPGWQMTPIPSAPMSPEQVCGVRRKRWVPLAWLRLKVGLKLPSKDYETKLRVRKGKWGENPGQTALAGWDAVTDSPVDLDNQPTDGGGERGKHEDCEYVLLEEFFFFHDRKDRLARYIVKVGDYECLDDQFDDESVYVPIGVGRYHTIGGFYGRSFVEPLIPLNSEMEQLLQNLCQNIKDLDIFGLLLIPNTWGIPMKDLAKGKSRKVVGYEPDYASPDTKQQHIAPTTANDIPGRVLVQLGRMLDELVQHSEMLRGEAPGRVDSASGLQYLNETSSIPLTEPARGIAQAFTQVYKAILAAAPELLGDRKDLPLLRLDDNLLGLRVDPTGKNVMLTTSNFPRPYEVDIGIRDEMPVSPTLRKRELAENLKMGLVTPQEYRIICWRENLDDGLLGSWAEKEAYSKAMLQCLYAFGDGETPGENILPSSEADVFDIHLQVIQSFMAKPEFTFASIAVRQVFEALKAAYMGFKGSQYPQQMPLPEEAAEISQQMGPMGPPGGGPPMG